MEADGSRIICAQPDSQPNKKLVPVHSSYSLTSLIGR